MYIYMWYFVMATLVVLWFLAMSERFDGSPHGAREATKDGDPSTVLFEGPTVPTGSKEKP